VVKANAHRMKFQERCERQGTDIEGRLAREALLQQRMRRQAAEYFSMVRRRLCCASRLRRSTSLSTSTLNPFLPFESIGRLRAISCSRRFNTLISLLPRASHFLSHTHRDKCRMSGPTSWQVGPLARNSVVYN